MLDGLSVKIENREQFFFKRLLNWFGRLHPFIVHFPIAFFPSVLFTAVAGHQRAAFAATVQFLVVAGGIFYSDSRSRTLARLGDR